MDDSDDDMPPQLIEASPPPAPKDANRDSDDGAPPTLVASASAPTRGDEPRLDPVPVTILTGETTFPVS